MADLTSIIEAYVLEQVQERAKEISRELRSNIKKQLYEGHGYDTGNLKRNIRTDTRNHEKYSIITGYYDEGNANYGQYVLRGIRGKGRAKAGPIDFLGDGLKATLELYG